MVYCQQTHITYGALLANTHNLWCTVSKHT